MILLVDILTGYKGRVLKLLEEAKMEIGDNIRIIRGGEIFEGTLMPRYELADDEHIVVKLRSGYNIGIRISPTLKVEKTGIGSKPAFIAPSLPEDWVR